MTNQETNVTNSAESTLSSALALGATTVNVTDTSDFPAASFYVVIDPDLDAKREVVLATAKTGTTLTVTRGQDGTSDVAHDSGAIIAVVPVAALWTDINDRVDGHAHGGGSDGATIATADLTGHTKAAHDTLALDHGSLSGLADFTADHGTDHDTHDHAAVTGVAAIKDDVDAILSAASATVATEESTSSSTYTDLTTSGPAVTVTTGTKALVIVAAAVRSDTANEASRMSVAVSGATTDAADDSRCFSVRMTDTVSGATKRDRGSSMHLFTGLTAGSNTFTAKYTTSGGTAFFGDRELVVIPIGD